MKANKETWMAWRDGTWKICKALFALMWKIVVFFIWVLTSFIEIGLKSLNTTMKTYLFPNRK